MPEQISVGWIVYNPRTKEILLHERDDRTPPWDIFGGDGDGAATYEEGLERELSDELRIKANWKHIRFLREYHNAGVLRKIYVVFSKQKEFHVREGKGAQWFKNPPKLPQDSQENLDYFKQRYVKK